jgi:hypothetical protein
MPAAVIAFIVRGLADDDVWPITCAVILPMWVSSMVIFGHGRRHRGGLQVVLHRIVTRQLELAVGRGCTSETAAASDSPGWALKWISLV